MHSIKIRQLFDYDTWTYTYLIWCPITESCVLIDPVLEQMDRDLTLINNLNLKLEYILETHVHADHITAANAIRGKSGAKIIYGEKSGVKGADILMKDNNQCLWFLSQDLLKFQMVSKCLYLIFA